ncbi:protein takeout [Episyrphus balteatus]|uniref:protein takeout n=1 Tax=Episyrphus balteatus TaxID=286459 RepID=UPI00248615A2|nr:protein takeout [Episyrphus balteatus]
MSAQQLKPYILSILLCCLFGGNFAALLPANFRICRRSDPNLNGCIKNCVEDLRDRMPVGIPQLHIPPLEPLLVPEVKLDQDSGAVYLHSTYKDIEIRGLSQFDVENVIANIKNNTLTMQLRFPKINLKANYSLRGKIMMMPLLGEGICMANLSDVQVLANVVGSRYLRKGNEHLKIDDVKIRYNIGDTKIHLDNLFNGDNTLGEKMNDFLNENWRSVSEEMRPIMEDAMAEVLRQTTEKLFQIYTYDQLLPA